MEKMGDGGNDLLLTGSLGRSDRILLTQRRLLVGGRHGGYGMGLPGLCVYRKGGAGKKCGYGSLENRKSSICRMSVRGPKWGSLFVWWLLFLSLSNPTFLTQTWIGQIGQTERQRQVEQGRSDRVFLCPFQGEKLKDVPGWAAAQSNTMARLCSNICICMQKGAVVE